MSLLKRCAALVVVAFLVMPCGVAVSAVQTGKQAPGFTLKDMKGKSYDLSTVKSRTMTVLYFFDATSRPSQEFLLTVDGLARKYQNAGLTVWGITASPRDAVNAYMQKANPQFPILLDTAKVSDAYNARLILPTTCVVGPDLKVVDYLQGGGKTSNTLLVRLAQHTLQQNQTSLAAALSDSVIKADPKNTGARMVKGYAALKAGRTADAEKTFGAMAGEGGQAEILGKEGLAGVYARRGMNDKALKVAEELEKKAPDRGYAHVVKGDILYSRNDRSKAESEYQKAVQKKGSETFQASGAYNRLGRLYASAGKYDKSRQLYDKAIEIDPFYVEPVTNKGVTYEKEGNWDKALDTYKQGQSLNKDDVFAASLAKRASDMLAYQNDPKQKERIDRLVKDLSERYRSQKKAAARADEDTWTSRPMVVSFVDFQETGSLTDRDGFSTVITTQLSDQLNASGRVKVVERVLIDRLLQELNIGSSELADPDTALKLGRVLAAKIISTGTILHVPGSTMMSLRLIDTETTAMPKSFNVNIPDGASVKKELGSLNRDILTAIIQNYPLHAFVVSADGKQAMINLGAAQGVVAGTTFEVIEEKAPVEYKGKLLKSSPEVVAKIEVVKVDPDLSTCRIVEQKRPLKRDDKVVEKVEEAGRG